MEIIPTQLENYLLSLSPAEKNAYDSFSSYSRKLEFAAIRHLKHEVLGPLPIHKDETGAPTLEDGRHLSFSHSTKYVALGLNDKHKCAIDIEAQTPKAFALKHKFLASNEEQLCSNEKDATLIWSFKETLYKLSDRKGLIFKTDLLLEAIDENSQGTVQLSSGLALAKLHFLEYDNHFITFNSTFQQI